MIDGGLFAESKLRRWEMFSSTFIGRCCQQPLRCSARGFRYGPDDPKAIRCIYAMFVRTNLPCSYLWYTIRKSTLQSAKEEEELTVHRHWACDGSHHIPVTVEDWVSVVDQSQKWGCASMKSAALAKLQGLPMEPALKIATWRRYALDETQIASCYHAIGTRTQPLSAVEGRLLGLDMVVKLSALRDTVQQGVLSYLTQSAQNEDYRHLQLSIERVKDLICRGLLLEYMQ